MIGVLARLQWMTLRGRVIRSVRLLRQPKYLVGFVVGFGWIAFWMIRPLLAAHVGGHSLQWMPGNDDLAPTIHRFAALVVTILLPLPWLLPWGPLGLPFREAELTMLLQAPLTRRQVIQYGLLKSEAGVVLGALIVSLMRAGNGPFAWLLAFCGTWILFDFWHLNGRWRALFNLRQREIPLAAARRRRWLVTLGLLAFYAALLPALAAMAAEVGALVRTGSRAEVVASLAGFAFPPRLVALTTPAWWLTAPAFARGGIAFVAAIVPAVLVVLAQREVVLRSRARFEERALERARAQETRKSPTRRFARLSSRARLGQPFALDRPGRAAVALVWKNLMRVSRLPWPRIALGGTLLVATITALPAVLRLPDASYGILAAFGLFLTFSLPFGAGTFWNNDLRTDLAHIELVRTWPLSARHFVLAQVVSPALVSLAGSTFGALLVLCSLFGSRLREALTGAPSQLVLLPRADPFLGVSGHFAAVALFASFLPMAAAVAFFSSALQNLAILVVPAWMAHSADRSRGVSAFGARMLFFSALGLAFLVAMIPSSVLVVVALLVQHWLGVPWSAWEFPLWATLAAAPLFFGGWLVVQVAARLWERLDPSQELLEIGR